MVGVQENMRTQETATEYSKEAGSGIGRKAVRLPSNKLDGLILQTRSSFLAKSLVEEADEGAWLAKEVNGVAGGIRGGAAGVNSQSRVGVGSGFEWLWWGSSDVRVSVDMGGKGVEVGFMGNGKCITWWEIKWLEWEGSGGVVLTLGK